MKLRTMLSHGLGLNATAGLKPDRLSAFSDGVFSIAITLLVLTLFVPGAGISFVNGTKEQNIPLSQFGHDLGHQWPTYLAFGVSFATIGVIWINHAWLVSHICKVNRFVLFLNLVVMITVVLLPFTTAVMASFLRSSTGHHHTQHAAAWVYVGSLLAMSVTLVLLWIYVDRWTLVNFDSKRSWPLAVGPFFYCVAIGLAFWNVTYSLILCLVVAGFYVFPWGTRANS